MNPSQVLIERTALAAVCDPENPHHDAVTAAYLALIEEFEDDKLLLVAVSDHIPGREWYTLRRRGPLAVVDSLHVGFQHRRAAHRITDVADFDDALTLVMCQRNKVARMLTLNPQFEKYDDMDVQVVGQGDDVRA